eukprot:503930-Alexandrium_andersonii.AAC.1
MASGVAMGMRAADFVGKWFGVALWWDSVVEPSIWSLWSEPERSRMSATGHYGANGLVRAWHVFWARCALWLGLALTTYSFVLHICEWAFTGAGTSCWQGSPNP